MLLDKTAVVTGAGRNIGRAIALALAREGANLVLNDLEGESLAEVAQEIRALGRPATTVRGSVTESAVANELIARAVEEFGRVDILVNNAGIARDALIVRMTDEQWEEVLAVNLRGAFNCCRAAVRPMMRQRYGRIINISSVVGVSGNPGQANYAASKAGLIGLTKTLALELGSRNITVNAVAPGFIGVGLTEALSEEVREKIRERIPLRRLGTPEDVAQAVVFLASEAANYITGQVLKVDGGLVR
ncbi:MAG TPA: 3-oxoacyl-[acyl-carrier-protein] reductase [Armatimonadetes bacterium]|nr:3-oxoacyl-[acyl-carrier-protein] reductase [Armatimonadota bacterium]